MPSKDELDAASLAIADRWFQSIEPSAYQTALIALRAAEKVRRKAFLSGKVGHAYHIEVKTKGKRRAGR